MNYYWTIHALELIYFDSNTQETMKKQLFIFQILSTFLHYTEEISQIFDCNASVYMYFLRL